MTFVYCMRGHRRKARETVYVVKPATVNFTPNENLFNIERIAACARTLNMHILCILSR